MSRAISYLPILIAAMLLTAGCQQEMAKQPAYRPLEASDFFGDGRSERPLVAGTIARGHLQTDVAFFTGRRQRTPADQDAAAVSPAEGAAAVRSVNPDDMSLYVDTFPLPVTPDLVERGRERYTIFCAVCHDARGEGNGIVVQRGFTKPPSYHIDRLQAAPPGYLFAVVSQGYGSMPDYAAQIPSRDRWAIVAFVRALQLSQHARLDDLPEAERREALKHLEDRDGRP